jgi:hypothetical protein
MEVLHMMAEPQGQEDQQQRLMLQHVADISRTPSTYAAAFSVYVNGEGMLRVTFGEQLHPASPPVFGGSFTTSLAAARGLYDLLGRTIDNLSAEMDRRAVRDEERVN